MKTEIWSIPKAGSLGNLKKIPSEIPKPQGAEVWVKTKAIGLNFADIFAIKGLYSATPEGRFTPGLEFSGEVIKIGPEVTLFNIGDKVMGVTRFGGYCKDIVIQQDYLRKLPIDWTYSMGAAFPVQALTAFYALYNLGDLIKGDTVLIHSGAGGVGLFANRFAKMAGATTIGTCSSESKFGLMKKEGYDYMLLRNAEFEKELLEITDKKGLNIILDSIGGNYFKIGYKQLSPTGRLITFGSANFANNGKRPNYLKLIKNYLLRPKIDPLEMVSSNKSVMGFNLIWLYEDKNLFNRIFSEMTKLEIAPPHIGKTFSFDDMPEALNYFQSGISQGKVVIIP